MRSMRSMIGEIRSAESSEDLDWTLSDLIAGGPLEEFLAAAIAALPHVPDESFDVGTEHLDPALRDAVQRSLVSTQVTLALLQPSTAGSSGHVDLLRPEGEPHRLQELLYGHRVPPAVQEALYAGHVTYLALLTLLDDEPTPTWLRVELQRRLAISQHEYLGLLVAYATKAGLDLPEPLAFIEPLDLDAAEREGERERHAIDAYLDGRRVVQDRS